MPRTHAVERGLDQSPDLRPLQGRFGKMFPSLTAANFDGTPVAQKFVPATIEEIYARRQLAPRQAVAPQNAQVILNTLAGRMVGVLAGPTAVPQQGPIPAGYAFLGQFIDHDLTFDPVSSLQRDSDPA